MPSLIIKKYRSSEKSELTFESVEDLSVRELRENVSSKLGMSLDDLSKHMNNIMLLEVQLHSLQNWYMVGVC